MYGLHCIMFPVLSNLLSLQCTVDIIQWTLYTVLFKTYATYIRCTLPTLT